MSGKDDYETGFRSLFHMFISIFANLLFRVCVILILRTNSLKFLTSAFIHGLRSTYCDESVIICHVLEVFTTQ